MKVTTKVNLFTTIWIVSLLIIINIIIYFLFIETTIKMEENIVYKTANDITKKIQNPQSFNNLEGTLDDYLTEHSLIRILLPENKVIAEVVNDLELSQDIKADYTNKREAKTHVISTESGEKQVLIAHVPFQFDNQTMSLEIVDKLEGLEMRIEILRGILIFSTFIAAFLTLLGGNLLSKLIMKPILSMIYTMEEIEKNGTMLKINTHNNIYDEQQALVKTFNKMIDRLENNIEKQKQFVSDVSHEFKTPLTVIKSYTNLLRRQGFKNEEIAQEAIQAIHSEATRIQKMTETFLDLASLDKDKTLELNKVDIVDLCQSIIKQLRTVYYREINFHFEESPFMITLDELRIKQAIIILLDNAIKYSHDKIDCFIQKDSQNIIISVRDYGIGIPEEEIDNIFERFYRVDKARSRETGGSGLGLHIANRIVKLHNGKIIIKSVVGEGTIAKIIIPLNL